MSITIPPVVFDWTGEAMVPVSPKVADRYYVIGERYQLEPREERSTNSHNHFFASMHDAWANLPEDLMERFPSADHLRKYLLVKSGFCDQSVVACTSAELAREVALLARRLDQYAVISVSESVVTVFTARSQSMKAMGKSEFQKSKDACFDQLAILLGTSAETLKQNLGSAA